LFLTGAEVCGTPLEEAVREIPGVRGVEKFLHLPGTPVPARHAERRMG
jgi:hypothetical protein